MIPERYKNKGFTKVGQKKQAPDGAKHKWEVLAKKGDKYKIVKGGYRSMEDFSQHKDKDRQKRFWDRMGGKDSAKTKDPFSPLHWHKKFGTWQTGGNNKEILKYYAAQQGYNYSNLLADFLNETPENQEEFLMQIGGVVQEQQNQEEQVMQLIDMYAKLTESTVENIVEQLKQLSPEEQQSALQEMYKAVSEVNVQQQGGDNQVMQILQMFAEQNQMSIEQVVEQFEQLSPEEQQQFLQEVVQQMQGNEKEEGINEEELMQLFEAFSQKNNIPVEELIQEFQSLSSEEKEQFIQQMIQNIQEEQEYDEEMVEEEEMQKGGIPTIDEGYYTTTPEETPLLKVNSNRITMKGIDFPINAYDGDTGDFLETMQPNKEYLFDSSSIIEEPVIMQVGGIEDLKKQYELLKNQKKQFKNQKEKTIYEKTLKEKERLLNVYQSLIDKAKNTEFENEKEKLLKEAKDVETLFYNTTVENYTNQPIFGVAQSVNLDRWVSKDKNNVKSKEIKQEEATNLSLSYNFPQTKKFTGKNITYHTTLQGVENGKPIYKDEFGNHWTINNQGKGIVIQKSREKPKTKSQMINEVNQKINQNRQPTSNKTSNRQLNTQWSPLNGADEWRQKWMDYLGITGDNMSLDDIDDTIADFVLKNKDLYKDNPFINKGNDFLWNNLSDGKYGKVHASFLPPEKTKPTAEELFRKYQTPEEVPDLSQVVVPEIKKPDLKLTFEKEKKFAVKPQKDSVVKPEDNTDVGSLIKFNTKDLVGNALLMGNVARAFQPIDMPYKYTADVLNVIEPKIDADAILSELEAQTSKTLANINTNSPTGMAYNAFMRGRQLEQALKVKQDVAQKNQLIEAKNRMNLISTMNQNAVNQDRYNAQYVNDLQQTMANADFIKDQAINNWNKQRQDQRKVDETLSYMDMLTPTIVEEEGNIFEKLLGKRKFKFEKPELYSPINTD